MLPKYMDIKELSIHLKVAVSTIYSWTHKRQIPFRKHGRKLVFCLEEIEAWSNSRSVHVYVPLTISSCTPKKVLSSNKPDSSLKIETTEDDLAS